MSQIKRNVIINFFIFVPGFYAMWFSLLFILICSATSLIGDAKQCTPELAVPCNEDACYQTHCLGPENYGVNAAVRPRLCNGNWFLTVAGFYWQANQGGLEYAVDTQVKAEIISQENRTKIIRAEYLNPHFNWNWGFKLGLGYNTTCDGWDIGILWTRYHGKASSHDEAEPTDNHTLLPIWTNFGNRSDESSLLPTYAFDIETQWNLYLNLVDFELGREFWTSKRLAIRPFVGFRYAHTPQKFELQHKGGSWSEAPTVIINQIQNNKVDIENTFKGTGIRAGLNSIWNFGCGWSIFEETGFSLLHGRFHIDHDETNRDASSPFTKNTFFEIVESFHSSQFVLDLIFGTQWSTFFCNCRYGLIAKLSWESHVFFDQNQMWRVMKTYNTEDVTDGPINFLNDFSQRRGNLGTQGWALTFVFDF